MADFNKGLAAPPPEKDNDKTGSLAPAAEGSSLRHPGDDQHLASEHNVNTSSAASNNPSSTTGNTNAGVAPSGKKEASLFDKFNQLLHRPTKHATETGGYSSPANPSADTSASERAAAPAASSAHSNPQPDPRDAHLKDEFEKLARRPQMQATQAPSDSYESPQHPQEPLATAAEGTKAQGPIDEKETQLRNEFEHQASKPERHANEPSRYVLPADIAERSHAGNPQQQAETRPIPTERNEADLRKEFQNLVNQPGQQATERTGYAQQQQQPTHLQQGHIPQQGTQFYQKSDEFADRPGQHGTEQTRYIPVGASTSGSNIGGAAHPESMPTDRNLQRSESQHIAPEPEFISTPNLNAYDNQRVDPRQTAKQSSDSNHGLVGAAALGATAAAAGVAALAARSHGTEASPSQHSESQSSPMSGHPSTTAAADTTASDQSQQGHPARIAPPPSATAAVGRYAKEPDYDHGAASYVEHPPASTTAGAAGLGAVAGLSGVGQHHPSTAATASPTAMSAPPGSNLNLATRESGDPSTSSTQQHTPSHTSLPSGNVATAAALGTAGGAIAAGSSQHDRSTNRRGASVPDMHPQAATSLAAAQSGSSSQLKRSGTSAGDLAESGRFPVMQSTSNPNHLLIERLQSYKVVVKSLIQFFAEISVAEGTASKHWAKSTSHLASPSLFASKDWYSGKGALAQKSEGGLLDLVAKVEESGRRIGDSGANTESFIESHALPALKTLKRDIKSHIKNVEKEAPPPTKHRQVLASKIDSLKTAVDTKAAEGGDPWLLNSQARSAIRMNHHAEAEYHGTMKGRQETHGAYEAFIFGEIKSIIQRWMDNRNTQLRAEKESLESAASMASTVNSQAEWDLLGQRYPDLIVRDELPPADPNAYDYTYHDHELTQIVRQGLLERAEPHMFKTAFNQYLFVLTAAGYLHAFPPNTDLEGTDLSPLLSICLKAATIGRREDGFEIVEGKNSRWGSGSVARLQLHAPSTRSNSSRVISSYSTSAATTGGGADLEGWWNDIVRLSGAVPSDISNFDGTQGQSSADSSAVPLPSTAAEPAHDTLAVGGVTDNRSSANPYGAVESVAQGQMPPQSHSQHQPQQYQQQQSQLYDQQRQQYQQQPQQSQQYQQQYEQQPQQSQQYERQYQQQPQQHQQQFAQEPQQSRQYEQQSQQYQQQPQQYQQQPQQYHQQQYQQQPQQYQQYQQQPQSHPMSATAPTTKIQQLQANLPSTRLEE